MPTRSTDRELQTYAQTSSGVLRPRVFQGGVGEFPVERKQLINRRAYESGEGLVVVLMPMYVRSSDTHEQIAARDYMAACKELDRTPAGPTARELLFRYLSPSQLQTARRHNYFDVGALHPGLVELALERGGPLRLSTVKFRITRGFPNGNIELIRSNGARYNVCLHPTEPYPTDDICLAQMMSIRYDPEGFIQAANIIPIGDSPPLRPGVRMFSRTRRRSPSDLALPFLRDYPVPGNIILGQE